MRLIDADALIGKIEERYVDACIQVQTRRSGKGVHCGIALAMNRARNEIIEQPTIDAVPVVRCKDCEHRHSNEFCECRPENAFCSDGWPKEKEV